MWPTGALPRPPAQVRRVANHGTPQSRPPKMSQNYERLVAVIQATREDVEKAEAGNKAATSRVRKAMQDIKNIAQEIRKEMLEVRDAGGGAKA